MAKVKKTEDTHVTIAIIIALVLGILIGLKLVASPVNTGSNAAGQISGYGLEYGGGGSQGAQPMGIRERIGAVICVFSRHRSECQ